MRAGEHARTAALEDRYWWFVARRRVVLDLLDRAGAPAGDAVAADVGCGGGAQARAYARRWWTAGVDPSPDALALTRARAGVPVVAGRAESLPLATASVDVLSLLDVLEHCDDDAAAAREAFRVLRPGGILVLCVPAYQWLWSGEDVVSEHRRRYTRGPLRRVLTAAGFRVERLSYFFLSTLSAVAAVVLLGRLFVPSTRTESNLRPIPGWMNALLTRVCGLEGRLVRRVDLPFGASIVGICRRPGDQDSKIATTSRPAANTRVAPAATATARNPASS